MAKKVLLVEDDNNLREIYEARLQAEGYDIVSASDGEQALVVAKDAKPDLVISDVMMPKISGFEMLDILRNTDGLTDVKVIMLTALGQAEDKTRADELGADRYLVKSQVTLEDIVKTAHQLLDDDAAATAANAPTVTVTAASTPAASAPATEPAKPVTTPTPVATEPAEPAATPTLPAPAAPAVTDTPAVEPVTAPIVATSAPTDVPVATPPVSSPAPVTAEPAAETADQEKADMAAQITSFEQQPATPAPVVEPAPDTTANDKTMSEAVDSLSPPAEQKPSDVAAVEVAPEPVETAPTATVATTTSTAPAIPAPTMQNSQAGAGDSVTIAHKKVIQPLNDISLAKPDINALLAVEEAKTAATPAVPTPEPAAPIAPTPAVAPAATPAPTVPVQTPPVTPGSTDQPDPSSIAL